MSRTTTSCPSSAKHAPVTSPTQPAPKIPMFAICRSLLSGCCETANARALPARERLETLRDRDHRLIRERVEKRVHNPIRRAVRAQHDHVELRAGVVEVVRPPVGKDVPEA